MDGHDRYLRLLLASRDDLQGYCLSLVKTWTDADELFQRTAVVTWEHFGSYDPQRSFAQWARGIARNLALKHFRERRRLVHMDGPVLEAIERAFAEQTAAAGAEAEQLAALQACLDTIAPPLRSLLAWRYGENRPIATIAAGLNRSVVAVTKQLSRLRAALQECIEQRLKELAR